MKRSYTFIQFKFILCVSTIFLSVCGFINSGVAQTTIYTTDFGTVANVNPSGWTFTGVDMNISTNVSSSGYSGASGNAYLGEGNSTAFINTSGASLSSSQIGTSEAILLVNTTGYSTITISFGMRKSSANYNSNATYSFAWSTNGTTYNTIAYTEATAGSWGLASGAGLTLPSGAGNQSTLYLKWKFVRTGTSSNFKIDDVFVRGNTTSSNTAPTIVMDVATTTNYLDHGTTIPPLSPDTISGVLNDPTDPASTLGIDFTINDAQTAASSLIVSAVSSNAVVVPTSTIILSGTGASRNIKITPNAVGYSTITINVTDGTYTTSYIIYYGASAASSTPSNTIWHTAMSDASDAIPLDDDFYLSADDELNVINVYSRVHSGLPILSFDYTALINLSDPNKPETDIEAVTNSPINPNKKYWLGSMSTGGSSFSIRPNRDRLFATLISGTGAATTFTVNGYTSLRSKLVSWGDLHGYNFSASAAAGVDSKSTSGYAAEGMVFGPDNTTLYIGFRAPLVPTSNRTNAVIAPIANFETWFNNGSPVSNPTIGAPIELNLGGRGIRDLIRLSNSTYIIVGGNPAGSPIASAIYKWTGNALDTPILIPTSASGLLNIEGVMQTNVNNVISMTQLQLITDNGDNVYYNDGTVAKDFTTLALRKFRLDNLTGLDLCLTTAATPVITQSGFLLTSTTASSYQWYFNNVAIAGATSQSYTALQNGNYYVTVTNSSGCPASSAIVSITTVGIKTHTADKNAVTVFPNPYNESTSIQLTVAENSPITMEVYSLLGQKIQTITNTNYVEGTYTFNFGAKKLGYSAGVYLIKTIVNDTVTITRIIENN